MGLLLSVLVACVGVVELLAFYSNIQRNLFTVSTQNDLQSIGRNYVRGLEKHREELCSHLEEFKELQPDSDFEISSNKLFEKAPPVKLWVDDELFLSETSSSNKNVIKAGKSHTKQLIVTESAVLSRSHSPAVELFVRSRSRSPTLSLEQEFRRPPSPYPSLITSVKSRDNIYSELLGLDERVNEIDEELYKSQNGSRDEKIDYLLESSRSTTNYWHNKSLAVPPCRRRFRSRSHGKKPRSVSPHLPDITNLERRKSKSDNFIDLSSLIDSTSCKSEEDLLNTLDGVKNTRHKIKHKKSLTSRKMTDEPSKTLIEAANVLKNVSGDTEAKESDKNEKEPFWLIFSGEYTKAMNKDWHGQHFCCWQCDESLTGQRYVLRDEHPYCVSCYESVFANACEKCSRTIGIDSKDLSYKDKHWHEACFLCTTCGESLVDKQFGSKGDRIYCGRCYDEQFASRCDGCHEIFRAGTKKMEYKTRQWHEKCFCCCVCKVPIGTQSFIPREQEIYCAKCYEEKFATRCIKCNKVITSGGVTYKNEPWHRECFVCTHCAKSLAGERFTSRDEKPYCADCFGELFAKRCFACSKPITGIGGTKFISFEDRHWHNDCFFCASCRTSLVGRGFITDQDDIICPDCAKQKLM